MPPGHRAHYKKYPFIQWLYIFSISCGSKFFRKFHSLSVFSAAKVQKNLPKIPFVGWTFEQETILNKNSFIKQNRN
jgi:hypothetical protein